MQLATGNLWENMKRHRSSRFPQLNRPRINETVATDTFFSSTDDIHKRTCAQIFYGLQSHCLNFYPMKSKSEGPSALADFICEEGIPNIIHSDYSKMQRGPEWIGQVNAGTVS
jgi:hypothetical protein